MAHFARVNQGTVREVIVINNADCGGGDFPDSEPIGQTFISEIGLDGEWKQTSYNGNFRGIYAGVGFIYDSDLNIFIAPIEPQTEESSE